MRLTDDQHAALVGKCETAARRIWNDAEVTSITGALMTMCIDCIAIGVEIMRAELIEKGNNDAARHESSVGHRP